jgi:hypothetical protein
MGGNIKVSDVEPSSTVLSRLERIHGLLEKTAVLGVTPDSPAGMRAAAGELLLEGLNSFDKISRSEERGFAAADRKAASGQELYRDYTMERNRYKKPLN